MTELVQGPVKLPSFLQQLPVGSKRQEPFQVRPAGSACMAVKAVIGHKLLSQATSFKDCTQAAFAFASIDLVAAFASAAASAIAASAIAAPAAAASAATTAITKLGRHSYRQARLMRLESQMGCWELVYVFYGSRPNWKNLAFR